MCESTFLFETERNYTKCFKKFIQAVDFHTNPEIDNYSELNWGGGGSSGSLLRSDVGVCKLRIIFDRK